MSDFKPVKAERANRDPFEEELVNMTNRRDQKEEEEEEDYSDSSSGTDSEEEEEEETTSSYAKPEPTRGSANSSKGKANINLTRNSAPTVPPKSQANGSPKRGTSTSSSKMPTPVNTTTNAKALSPYGTTERASAPAPAITNKSSGSSASHAHIDVDIDTNIMPEEDRTFKKTIPIVWSGKADEPVVLDEGDLKNIFSVEVLNPDKSMEQDRYYAPRALKDFFLRKVALIQTSNSTTQVLLVRIGSRSADLEEDLEYLNAQKAFTNTGRGPSQCMFTIPPGNATFGKCGKVLVDNEKFVGSRAFLTFGHVDLERIKKDIEMPSNVDEDQRLRYPANTAIGQMILKDENKKDLERTFEEGSMERARLSDEERRIEGRIDKIGTKIHIGPRTLARAISLFDRKVRPMIRGKHNLSGGSLTFSLGSSTGKSVPDHTVLATLEITYAFSRGSRDAVEEIKLKKEEKRINPLAIFANELDGHLSRASSKAPTARKQ